MEYAIASSCLTETPENRATQRPHTVKDALQDMLHTESRGAYLRHYDNASLSAIVNAVEECTLRGSAHGESRSYYKTINSPIEFHLITIEKRTQSELDMIQKLIDIPHLKIYEAIKMLSV